MVNKVQGIITIDKQEMTDEEFEEFKQFTNSFFIHFTKLNTVDNRELYSCLARNKELLFDREDEEGNIIEGALSLLSYRNPQILGIWGEDGLLLGTKIVKVAENIIDEEGNVTQEEVWETQGNAEYPFDKATYISFMPDIVTYDNEGNETNRTRPTEAKQLHKFSGYADLVME